MEFHHMIKWRDYLCEVVIFIHKLLDDVEMICVRYVFKSNRKPSGLQGLQDGTDRLVLQTLL